MLSRVLDTTMLAEAAGKALAEIRAGQTTFPDQRLAVERTLAVTETRLRHLVEAIATGQATDVVFSELQKAEAEKQACAAHLDQLIALAAQDGTRIERVLVERVADVKAGLGRHVTQTRQIIRKLIPGRIRCAPFNDARGRGYELTAEGTYAGLLSGALAVRQNVLSRGGGEGGIAPSLTDALSFRIQAVALVA